MLVGLFWWIHLASGHRCVLGLLLSRIFVDFKAFLIKHYHVCFVVFFSFPVTHCLVVDVQKYILFWNLRKVKVERRWGHLIRRGQIYR